MNITYDLRNTATPESGHSDGRPFLEPVKASNNGVLPSTAFSRMRILMGGQVVEDVTSYNRVSFLASSILQPAHALQDETNAAETSVKAGESINFGFRPLSGLFAQSKYLPLKYGSLSVELTLCPADEWLATGGTTTQNFQLENVTLSADTITLDSELQNQFDSFILSGNPMPISFSTYSVSEHVLTGATFAVQLYRAMSRLQSVFFTFERDASKSNTVKKANQAYHSGEQSYQWQLSIDGKKFPSAPAQGFAQSLHRLYQATGINGSPIYSLAVSGDQYRDNSFAGGIDTEAVLGTSSGIDTRGGSLITLNGKDFGTANPTSITVVAYHQSILNLRTAGAEVLA